MHVPDEERIVLQTRPDVQQPFYLTKPPGHAAATLVLFTGGNGKLGEYGPPDLKRGNFLLRSRNLFVDEGFAVAVMDLPSDQLQGIEDFRTSPEHAADIRAVVDWLRPRLPPPVRPAARPEGTA